MLDYFTSKKGKAKVVSPQPATPTITDQARKQSLPLLSPEDEAFLHHIETNDEGTPPPLPTRPQDLPIAGESTRNNQQLIPVSEALQIPLPDVPDTPQEPVTTPGESKKKTNRWSFLKFDGKSRDRKQAGDVLHDALVDSKATGASAPEPRNVTAGEASKENEEIESVLEQLNMAAVNNMVFSLSDETRELLRKFTLVFKDLVNGVPTAYHDLEALLTNSEDQIQKMWLGLPPFLQQLVSKLPAKFTAGLGPEVLAAAAEKPSVKADLFSKGVDAANKSGMKFKVPNLKDLVGKKGALISLFRTIMTSLRTRFPAILGVNVLWSIGITMLLLVCWYCHKRGKEVRLEKERAVTEAEMEEIKKQVESEAPGEWNENMTTLAPEGATIEEVRASLAPAAFPATPGLAEYAEGGSLAQAMREEAAAKQESSKEKPSGSTTQATSTGEHA